MTTEVLARIERYYDTAPRALADAHEVGPFTAFVARTGWPYYARPRLGRPGDIHPADVTTVARWLSAHDQPVALEWTHEITPSLASAARSAGLVVHEHPLLILERRQEVAPPADVSIHLLTADSPELAAVAAVIAVGFETPGTAIGSTGATERDARVAGADDRLGHRFGSLIDSGLLTLAGAVAAGEAVGGGSHSPRGDVTELTGIATLPAWRRRGIATAVTAALVADAVAQGVHTVFLSADSDDVARVYSSVGFVRIATACAAEAAQPASAEPAAAQSAAAEPAAAEPAGAGPAAAQPAPAQLPPAR
ncbi:MAG: GNAT family N-acetyltransferase [Actinomycetota bacterium]|nr:GNAT family N-acetyltransferase [Actinomycetota bacterium]